MLRLSDLGCRVQAAAVARECVSGLLRLVGGKRPSDPTKPADPELVIADLPIGASDVSVDADGVCVIGPVKGRVSRKGKTTWFQIVTSNFAPVLDGDVGLKYDGETSDNNRDIKLSRVELLPGDMVTIDELHLHAKHRPAE